MADYPVRGLNPWDEELKEYIDETIAESVADSGAGTELAYAENNTATPTTITTIGSDAIIPGCLITVPADVDPVWVEYAAFVTVTVAGGGLVVLSPWDVTAGGTGTQLTSTYRGFVAAQLPLYSGLLNTIHGRLRLEPSTSDRLVQLKVARIADGGSSFAAEVANNPSYITAVQR